LKSFDFGIGYIIRNQVGGCDCEDIGTWPPGTLTCTLTGDVGDIIEIDSDGITLDGDGYSATEIYVHENSGYIIENFVGASYINIYGLRPYSDSGIIRGNVITGVVGNSINIMYGNYIEITDNTISHCTESGIFLYGSSNINITDNTIHDIDNYGIGCWDGSRDNNIIDNTIYDNRCGISLMMDYHQNIKHNTINDNICGIGVWMSGGHVINDNTISNNINEGIYMGDEVYRNTIIKNSISGNEYGIYMKSSLGIEDSDSSIICNNILNNDYGIYIMDYMNNSIYHNNLIDNAINNGYESLELGSNQWCIMDEGNYWSNYDEPCESCVDSDDDGICDSPYHIPGGSGVDYYPLSSPLCSPDWCEIYDTNGMDGIQKDEAVNAINDYLIFHTINKKATVAVLNCYFGL
jgi:parallel beta-helix repeat protein